MRACTRDARRRSTTPPIRPWLGALGATLAALAIVAAPVAAAPPASAHSALVASDPEPGATLAAAPEQLTLTFNEDLIEVGAAVFVVDEAGAEHAGEPLVEGAVLTVPVEGSLPAGSIELRWRVVSADGHPISDVLRFTVEQGPTATAPAAEDDAASVAPIAEPTPGATDAGDAAAAGDGEESGPPRTLLVGIAGAAAALIVLMLVLGARRARRRRTASQR